MRLKLIQFLILGESSDVDENHDVAYSPGSTTTEQGTFLEQDLCVECFDDGCTNFDEKVAEEISPFKSFFEAHITFGQPMSMN